MNLLSESVAYGLLFFQPFAALLGIVFNVRGVRLSLEDLACHESELDDRRKKGIRGTSSDRARGLVAQLAVEYELIRLCVQALLLFIGALVVINPPDHLDRPFVVAANRIALMLITMLVASKSILGQHNRNRVIRLLQNGHAKRRLADQKDLRKRGKVDVGV